VQVLSVYGVTVGELAGALVTLATCYQLVIRCSMYIIWQLVFRVLRLFPWILISAHRLAMLVQIKGH